MKNPQLIAVYAGAVLLIAFSTPAQNLFATSGTNILEITPSGTQSIFATGLGNPGRFVFNSTGDLFVADGNSIAEITPSGIQSTFASEVNVSGLAFNSAGNLFAGDSGTYSIYQFTPDGTRSTFASLVYPSSGLAFNNAGDLFVTSGTQSGIKKNHAGGNAKRLCFRFGWSRWAGL